MDLSERLAFCSTFVNLCLVFLKYGLAVFSGSLALRADAIHSIADVISSASIWAGVRISRRKTKLFPYGLHKVENLVALCTVGLLFWAGYEIVQGTLEVSAKMSHARLPIAMGGVAVIILITLAFSRFELKKGNALGSPSLVADAQHIASDMLAAVAILVGLIGSYFQIQFPLDKGVALIIVALIGWSGFKIAVDAIRVLLDASLDFAALNTIREIILKHPQVKRINGLTGRNSGRFKFIEMDLALRIKDFQKAHLITGQIESQIRAQIPNVDRVIHYEPIAKETSTYAMPVEEDKQTLSEHFGEAPYFLLLVVDSKDRKLLEERIVLNTSSHLTKGKGIKVAEWLIGLGVDEVIVPKSLEHKGPFYVLTNAGAEMQQTELRSIVEIKSQLIVPLGI